MYPDREVTEDLWVQKEKLVPLEKLDPQGYQVITEAPEKEASLGREVCQGPRAPRGREDRRVPKDLRVDLVCQA